MNIILHELGAGVRDYTQVVPAEAFDWDPDEGFTVTAPVRVALRATRVPGVLLITGTLSTEVECRCRRCDQPFRLSLEDREFNRSWTVSADGLHWTGRLEDDEIPENSKTRDGKGIRESGPSLAGRDSVDLTEDIREAIILAFPGYPVCRPDCKGLCSRCGKNLNRGACGCAPPEDNRWVALENLSPR